jgi:hypothetical protein
MNKTPPRNQRATTDPCEKLPKEARLSRVKPF